MRTLRELHRSISWANFFVVFLPLLAIYMAALVYKFAQNDDYYYFAYDSRNLFSDYPQKAFFNLTGRQLYNVLHGLFAVIVKSIPDLAIIRLIDIVFLAISGSLLVRFFEKFNVPRSHATIFVLLLLILPGFQAGVVWATMAPFSVALLFALYAGVLAQRAVEGATLKWRQMTFSLALVVAALFIYQPWAMFYLLPFVIALLFNPDSAARYGRMFFVHGSIFVVALLLYYVVHHRLYLPHAYASHPELRALADSLGRYRFEVNEHIGARIYSLLATTGSQLLQLWDIYGHGWGIAVSLGTLSLSALMLAIRRQATSGDPIRWRNFGLISIGVACAFLASLSPLIAAAGGGTWAFRTILPATAILLMLVCRGLYDFQNILTKRGGVGKSGLINKPGLPGLVVSGGILLVASCSAFSNVYASSYNSVIELEYLKGKITERANTSPDVWHIRVTLNEKPSSYLNLPSLGDGEFNYNSSSNWPNIPWMIRSILLSSADSPQNVKIDAIGMEKTPPEHASGKIVVSVVEPSKKYDCMAGELCIDMNDRALPRANWWLR